LPNNENSKHQKYQNRLNEIYNSYSVIPETIKNNLEYVSFKSTKNNEYQESKAIPESVMMRVSEGRITSVELETEAANENIVLHEKGLRKHFNGIIKAETSHGLETMGYFYKDLNTEKAFGVSETYREFPKNYNKFLERFFLNDNELREYIFNNKRYRETLVKAKMFNGDYKKLDEYFKNDTKGALKKIRDYDENTLKSLELYFVDMKYLNRAKDLGIKIFGFDSNRLEYQKKNGNIVVFDTETKKHYPYGQMSLEQKEIRISQTPEQISNLKELISKNNPDGDKKYEIIGGMAHSLTMTYKGKEYTGIAEALEIPSINMSVRPVPEILENTVLHDKASLAGDYYFQSSNPSKYLSDCMAEIASFNKDTVIDMGVIEYGGNTKVYRK